MVRRPSGDQLASRFHALSAVSRRLIGQGGLHLPDTRSSRANPQTDPGRSPMRSSRPGPTLPATRIHRGQVMKSTVQAIVTLIVAIALTFAAVVWADSAAARGATSRWNGVTGRYGAPDAAACSGRTMTSLSRRDAPATRRTTCSPIGVPLMVAPTFLRGPFHALPYLIKYTQALVKVA